MTSQHYPFKEISPWVEAPADLQPPLDEDLQVDVVVIGGGFTGLSTALSLRERGASVAILEKEFAGSGASGRNAGHLTPTIGKDIPSLLRFLGKERTTRLLEFADAAIDYTEEMFKKNGIDCEYEPNGNIIAGVHPKQEAALRKAAEISQTLSAPVRFFNGAEMRERGLPDSFLFGVFEEHGGTLNPGQYVMGLRRAAIAAGIRLFETSPLLSLDEGSGVMARTAGGSIRADIAVLATNAYTKEAGFLPRLIAPLRVSLFETQPLDQMQLDTLGWRGREGLYTAHEILEGYRLTRRNTIIGGSKFVRYGYGSSLTEGYDTGAFEIVERAFRQRFPTLDDLDVAHYWGGWIGLSLYFLPSIGSLGQDSNIIYGLGYAGHGVAQAGLMGEMLADKAQGKEHEWEAALRRRKLLWPPEPLRWASAKLLSGVLGALDRRTDKQIPPEGFGPGSGAGPDT